MIANFEVRNKSFSMEALYQVAGYSRQAFWKYKQRLPQKKMEEQRIVGLVLLYRMQHPGMGSRVLYNTMKNNGEDLGIGITKFEQLLSRRKLSLKNSRRKYPKTSDGLGKNKYSNLTNGLVLVDVNQLIVGDITYYWLEGDWHYIFMLKDMYSQFILGIQAARSLEAKHAISVLDQAIKIRGEAALEKCIHHSDNGSQYDSIKYVSKLKRLNMVISRAQNCLENGSAEQLNHIVKNMYFQGWGISTFKELQVASKRFKYLNNHQRAISQLGNICPAEYEKYLLKTPMAERTKKILHDFTIHN